MYLCNFLLSWLSCAHWTGFVLTNDSDGIPQNDKSQPHIKFDFVDPFLCDVMMTQPPELMIIDLDL